MTNEHFSFMSERCPWASIPTKGCSCTMISCNAVNRSCCKENCAPLHFVQNGVGKIICDRLGQAEDVKYKCEGVR